jgi:DNA-binding response OmpR family regulator
VRGATDKTTAGSILVVEDEVLLRLALADELRETGFTTIEAANGDEALAVLAVADISVIVTDYDMPGKTDGLGLAREVRRRRPEIKIILVSGKVVPDFERHVDSFFAKPYHCGDLIERIRYLIRNGPVPPAVEIA